MVNAGRILIVPKGVWSSLTSYDMLDLVTQDGVAYIARQANVGVQPKTDSQYTYWQPFGNASEPDNETIIYTENNKYTVNLDGKTLVYDSNDGITVAIDGETIKFDEDEGYLYAEVKSNLADLLDVVLTTPVNGQVLTYNALTGKWVNANPTGGMQAHLVITSEAGSVVTVTTPSGSVITATQVSGSTTQWECDTQEYGVHTIDAVLAGDDAQITQMVDTCKIYNIDDSHIHATITVTFPRGFTCRCQGQGENYYSNSNPYTFSVHHLGEFTITATDGADTTYTETVTISSSAQSVSMFCPSVENAPTDDVQMWLMFGGITDKAYTTLSEVLNDTTTLSTLIASHSAMDYLVGCKNWCGKGLVPKMTSNTTPSGIASSSDVLGSQDSSEAWNAFNIDSQNYWQGSHSAKNTLYTEWVSYTFTEATVVGRFYWETPAYKTTANLVTTELVLYGNNGGADTELVRFTDANGISDGFKDIPSANQGKYLTYKLSVSQKYSGGSWAIPVVQLLQFYDVNLCENATAMSYIGLNNYASNTLLADGNPSLIPIMTSNTTPSGTCIASEEYDTYKAYKAFDRDSSTAWYANSGSSTNQWVGYDFGTPKTIKKVKVRPEYVASFGGSRLRNINIQYSDDNVTWSGNNPYVVPNTNQDNEFVLSDYGSHRYWRMYVTDNYSSYNIGCAELQFCEKDVDWLEAICNSTYIESVLNLKNPVMTSDNTPSGYEASADSNLGSGVLPYKAFDGVINNYWQSQSSNVEHWLQLKFPQAVNIICFKAFIGRATDTLILRGSNDGNTFTLIKDFGAQPLDLSTRTYIMENNDANYDYYRLCAVATPAESNYQIFNIADMVYYGRVDV